MTKDELKEVIRKNCYGDIADELAIMEAVDLYSAALIGGKPPVISQLPPMVDDSEISKQSILQGSKEDHGCQAISQVYFRKGAKWMRDAIGGNCL